MEEVEEPIGEVSIDVDTVANEESVVRLVGWRRSELGNSDEADEDDDDDDDDEDMKRRKRKYREEQAQRKAAAAARADAAALKKGSATMSASAIRDRVKSQVQKKQNKGTSRAERNKVKNKEHKKALYHCKQAMWFKFTWLNGIQSNDNRTHQLLSRRKMR